MKGRRRWMEKNEKKKKKNKEEGKFQNRGIQNGQSFVFENSCAEQDLGSGQTPSFRSRRMPGPPPVFLSGADGFPCWAKEKTHTNEREREREREREKEKGKERQKKVKTAKRPCSIVNYCRTRTVKRDHCLFDWIIDCNASSRMQTLSAESERSRHIPHFSSNALFRCFKSRPGGGGVSRPVSRGQKFMCCVRNPRNINIFVRAPGREDRVPGREDRWPGSPRNCLCAKCLCAFLAPKKSLEKGGRKCAINNFWTKDLAGRVGWGSRGSRQIIYVRIFPNIWSVFGTTNRPHISNFWGCLPA